MSIVSKQNIEINLATFFTQRHTHAHTHADDINAVVDPSQHAAKVFATLKETLARRGLHINPSKSAWWSATHDFPAPRIEVPVVLKQQLRQIRAAVDNSAAEVCMSPEQADETKRIINQRHSKIQHIMRAHKAGVSTQLDFLLLRTVAASDATWLMRTQGKSARTADTLDNML
eukprot:3988672-Amphidinium_carterae.1